MNYYLILKYTYSYISSGNYYKEAVNEYYQLFKDENTSELFQLDYGTTHLIDIKNISKDKIKFSYKYAKYVYPNTFQKDTTVIENTYVLEKGQKVECECVDTYWVYAKGGENSPAKLIVEIISNETFTNLMLEKVKDHKDKAKRFGNLLINNEDYDLAYQVLSNYGKETYELGLCYEKGYGVKENLDEAFKIYLSNLDNEDCLKGMERLMKKRGENIENFDKIKKTVFYEKLGMQKDMYYSSFIPLDFDEKSSKEARRNVELTIIKFLELGRPSNDPFGNPTHTMEEFALYYDKINNIPEENKKLYYKVWYEEDIYDGGEFKRESFDNQLIIETIQQEASKNDVLALGVLINQYNDKITNHDELIEKLKLITNSENKNDRAMANYFLGLYYESIADKTKENYSYDYSNGKTYTYNGDDIEKEIEEFIKVNEINYENSLKELLRKLQYDYLWYASKKENNEQEISKIHNYIIYLYNKNYKEQSLIYEENINKAYCYFEKAVNDDLYLGIVHLAKKYLKDNPNDIIDKLGKYVDYIPGLSSHTTDYFEVLGIAYLYYADDYKTAKTYINKIRYRLEFEKVLCETLTYLEKGLEMTGAIMGNVSSLVEPYIKIPKMKYLYCILAYSDFYQNKYLDKYSSMRKYLEKLESEESINFQSMKEAAEAGYVPAFRRLASWYSEGFGTKVNQQLSDQWMNKYKEAVKNNPKDQYSILGKLFDDDLTYSNKKTYKTLM